MKDENAFRFSLKFPCKTDEQIQAGELLERMGNKKSRFIVQTINEYVRTHPEILQHSSPIVIKTSVSDLTRDELRSFIGEILSEKGYLPAQFTEKTQNNVKIEETGGVDDMLDYLADFMK